MWFLSISAAAMTLVSKAMEYFWPDNLSFPSWQHHLLTQVLVDLKPELPAKLH